MRAREQGRARPRGRRSRRGLTLLEVVIAVSIAAMASGLALGALNSLTNASLRATATDITGATKFAYDRAIMERRTERLAIDLDKGLYWIEATEDPFALAKELERGRAGAQLADDPKKDVDKVERSIFDENDGKKAVEAMLEGGKAARFAPDVEYGEPRTIAGNVKVSKIWTGHQEEAFTTGIAYVNFWSGGWTEPAQIELTDGDDFITLKLYPLTGRMRSYPRELEIPKPKEADGREEGDE